MPLEIVTVPCLADNYAFLIHAPETGETAVVDAPEETPIERALADHGWQLSHIFITHHHFDHIDAAEPLRAATGAKLIGAKTDAHRLPSLDMAIEDGDSFDFAGHRVQVLDVSGHTVGHIAFYIPDSYAVFTADSLMALGCGRVFEGAAEQMWASLSKIAALPPQTIVYSGHEYTTANAKFARTIEPNNAALHDRSNQIAKLRERGEPTVPSILSTELATNPFLRANLPEVKKLLNMTGEPDAAVFAEIRARKDKF